MAERKKKAEAEISTRAFPLESPSNKFSVDSGIRIPPGELYPVPLGEWENFAKIANTAVLCTLPVKLESLKAE